MEEIFVNIDSLYRNIITYPDSSKFTYVFNNVFKNIVSIKLASIELANTIPTVSSAKNNNYFLIHVPNRTNDPSGTIIQLPDILLQTVNNFTIKLNNIIGGYFNSYFVLNGYNSNPVEICEKYFYIFYLNSDLTILFDFNSCNTPPSLQSILTIKEGWTSIYGLVLQIKNYILKQYNARVEYLTTNPSDPINLDGGNFALVDSSGNNLVPNGSDIYATDEDGNNLGNNLIIDDTNGSILTIPVFDRRFRLGNNINLKNINDCTRNDPILLNNNPYNSIYDIDGNSLTSPLDILNNNLLKLKYDIYNTYIYDTNTFFLDGGTSPGNGIIDNLDSGNIYIPPGYLLEGSLLASKSIYYLNNSNDYPNNDSVQVYNLMFKPITIGQQIYLTNSFNAIDNPLSTSSSKEKFYYYYVDSNGQSWKNGTSLNDFNTVDNLLNQKYLFENNFITDDQFYDPYFTVNLRKDIAPFEIDFTNAPYINASENNITNVNLLSYPALGFILGYRPLNDSFILSSTPNTMSTDLNSKYPASLSGSEYIFIKINDWGYYNFFDKTVLGKVLLPSASDNNNYGVYATSISTINTEYKLRQPQNIKRLDIELLDYLGNTVNLSGINWSFTMILSVEYSSSNKEEYEKKNLVFDTKKIMTPFSK
jgi:hypothetical protein